MDDLEPEYEMSKDPYLEAELHIEAWRGLKSADLAPLAALMRSEFEIEATLRIAIADAIEGESAACRIEGKHLTQGKPIDDPSASDSRDLRIQAFVRAYSKKYGSKEAAVAAAKEKFGIGRSAIFAACKRAEAHPLSLPERL